MGAASAAPELCLAVAAVIRCVVSRIVETASDVAETAIVFPDAALRGAIAVPSTDGCSCPFRRPAALALPRLSGAFSTRHKS
jgi:hypothetical protein